jgi:hypothetical protein
MTLVENSQESNSRLYYKTVTSEMFVLQLKTHSPMLCGKKMHQTVGNVLSILLHGEPPQNIANAKEYVDEAISIAMHAMRAKVHFTLGSSPGSLTFNRDMFLNIPLIADWHVITQR